jgi:hypothetical protein
MTEPILRQPQLELGPPVDTLLVFAQGVPDDTVFVTPGNPVLSDDKTLFPFPGATSGSFAPLSGGQASRWDLLTLDLAGPVPVLLIVPGSPSASLQNWWDSVPEIPPGTFPLAAIHVTEIIPAPVLINPADIVDVRGYFNASVRLSASIHHDPADPTSWAVPVSPPDNVGESLDELASRVNNSSLTDPLILHATTPSLGVSKDASRADHRHAHGDLAGTAATHHDASQVEYAPNEVADWDVIPSDVQGGLDNLAEKTRNLRADEISYDASIPNDWISPPDNTAAALDDLASRQAPFTVDLGTFNDTQEAELTPRATVYRLTANENVSVVAPRNIHTGAHCYVQITQGGVGAAVLTWSPDVFFTDPGHSQLESTTVGHTTTWLIIRVASGIFSAFRLGDAVLANEVVFDSPGAHVWTVPGGVTEITVLIHGAGGGGGGSTFFAGGGGGGGAGFIRAIQVPVVPTEDADIIVGSGGPGGAPNVNGTAGGFSRFSDHGATYTLQANGGGLGIRGTSGGAGGAGGTTSISGISPTGEWVIESGNPGTSGGVFTGGRGGAAGGMDLGGGGQTSAPATDGVAGNPIGGGGSGGGGNGSRPGGAGAHGKVIILYS